MEQHRENSTQVTPGRVSGAGELRAPSDLTTRAGSFPAPPPAPPGPRRVPGAALFTPGCLRGEADASRGLHPAGGVVGAAGSPAPAARVRGSFSPQPPACPHLSAPTRFSSPPRKPAGPRLTRYFLIARKWLIPPGLVSMDVEIPRLWPPTSFSSSG